jgi:hypothetical protein
MTDATIVSCKTIPLVGPFLFHVPESGGHGVVPLDDLIAACLDIEHIVAVQTIFPGLMDLLAGQITGDIDAVQIRVSVARLALEFDLRLGVPLCKCHLSHLMGYPMAVRASETPAQIILVVEVFGPHLYVILRRVADHALGLVDIFEFAMISMAVLAGDTGIQIVMKWLGSLKVTPLSGIDKGVCIMTGPAPCHPIPVLGDAQGKCSLKIIMGGVVGITYGTVAVSTVLSCDMGPSLVWITSKIDTRIIYDLFMAAKTLWIYSRDISGTHIFDFHLSVDMIIKARFSFI